jgi:short subunit dehydrogenase-like uncharacterized protein
MAQWMIYGANGYTGKLIAQEARRRGLSPIVAGRNAQAVESLAQELSLPSRVFSCDAIGENLKGVELVLHCAGPFSATSRQMIDACLKSKTHYLDITGEISVFENIHSQNARIRQAGIVAIPGVGFDVVPTDGLAAMLKEKLPDATHLALAFKSSAKVSAGTAKTAIEGLGQDGAIRRDGKIVSVPKAYDVRMIRFNKLEEPAVTIPWGDVSTAYYSTGIPNIQVYLRSNHSAIRIMKLSRLLQPLLAISPVQKALKKLAGKFVTGPAEMDRSTFNCYLWGEVTAGDGRRFELRLQTPEAYALTVVTALAAVERVLAGQVQPGAWTPSLAFGSKFILEFDGVQILN